MKWIYLVVIVALRFLIFLGQEQKFSSAVQLVLCTVYVDAQTQSYQILFLLGLLWRWGESVSSQKLVQQNLPFHLSLAAS